VLSFKQKHLHASAEGFVGGLVSGKPEKFGGVATANHKGVSLKGLISAHPRGLRGNKSEGFLPGCSVAIRAIHSSETPLGNRPNWTKMRLFNRVSNPFDSGLGGLLKCERQTTAATNQDNARTLLDGGRLDGPAEASVITKHKNGLV